MFFLSLSQAKLDVGVALLSTHRLIWRDSKNHVRHPDITDYKTMLFVLLNTTLSYFVFCLSH